MGFRAQNVHAGIFQFLPFRVAAAATVAFLVYFTSNGIFRIEKHNANTKMRPGMAAQSWSRKKNKFLAQKSCCVLLSIRDTSHCFFLVRGMHTLRTKLWYLLLRAIHVACACGLTWMDASEYYDVFFACLQHRAHRLYKHLSTMQSNSFREPPSEILSH